MGAFDQVIVADPGGGQSKSSKVGVGGSGIIIIAVFPVPVRLAGLGFTSRVLERLWPTSRVDESSGTQFIHDQASVDVDSSLVLVDLEQRRLFKMLSQYFELVRQQQKAGST